MGGRVLFGTDGIRGEANVYPMTVDVAMQLGKALAHLVKEGQLGRSSSKSRPRIVIGKDTRLSGYCFEQAIAAGICAMGVDVMLVGPLPTPGIAFITRSMRADAGVVVSASHNPFYDNGIKIFGHDGYKLPDETEARLEQLILGDELHALASKGASIGKAKRVSDAAGRYVVYLKSVFPDNLMLDGKRIVLDCAHGAAYKVAPEVLRELGAEVITVGCEPDGLNINQEVGALHPGKVQELVHYHHADLGIALDGDADRVVFVDEQGDIADGDAIMAILASELHRQGRLKNDTLVTTVMSNVGLEQCLSKLGVQVLRTSVGDRYVMERMRQEGSNLGGEQSGHLIFLDHASTGDGMVAALLMLSLMCLQNKKLSEMKRVMKVSPRALVNTDVPCKVPLALLPKTNELIEKIETALSDTGRVLVRYSGTEKKVRVLVEAQAQSVADQYAQEITKELLFEVTSKSQHDGGNHHAENAVYA